MASCRPIDVVPDDRTPHKWIIPLTEDAFRAFMSTGNPAVCKVFGEGSLFSPMLFGKFFDPSDAFPLWEFEADILLANLRSSGHTTVDWFQTDQECCVLKAEVPGVDGNAVNVCFEKGKVLEISGQWKQQREPSTRDWRSSRWWETGYVRRIELPENADWKKTEATMKNDVILEVKIPLKPLASEIRQGNSSE
ncbi:hypothetical protein Nepgr_016248 [Nepenthes gracilis]|uniref:SHSP domain-containing protein n=1 Tax=Nepenthes gracilis TaxID=150966 RepID=A0AAD3SNV0_NEPGR|nr:hypothetical protein Nepgr_016248 [Nepenthes gracilis]